MIEARPCKTAACESPYYARGLCVRHYHQARRRGCIEPQEPPSAMSRFLEKAEPEPNSGCWLWTGHVHKTTGYGQICDRGFRWLAHRFSYTAFVGEIPKGLHIDHLCRTPSCVNPKHLEPVTPQENNRRGNSPSALNMRKTHCPKGHPYSGSNLGYFRKAGSRYCKSCDKQKRKERTESE